MTYTENILPSQLTAGDTLLWDFALSDYLADDGWIMKITFNNNTNFYTITGTASGSNHRASVVATTTANYVAGVYQMLISVSKASERYTLVSDTINILPNLAGATGAVDTRTSAQKALDAVNIALENYGDKAWMQGYTINGRSMSFNSPSEFMAFRSKLINEVNAGRHGVKLGKYLSGF